jgi:hypothetical protein
MTTDERFPRLLTSRAGAIAIVTLVVALALQAAIVAGSTLHGSTISGLSSSLLSDDHRLSDVVAIAAVNSAWLVALTLLAWPIARLWSWSIHDTWDHPYVNVAARIIYPTLALVLIVLLWWVFSAQAQALSERLVSRWALFATLPHGTLEFGALLLPLVAALSCIFAPAARPGRLLLSAFAVALPLILLAALVEVYVSPELIAPLRAAAA